MNQKALSTVC